MESRAAEAPLEAELGKGLRTLFRRQGAQRESAFAAADEERSAAVEKSRA